MGNQLAHCTREVPVPMMAGVMAVPHACTEGVHTPVHVDGLREAEGAGGAVRAAAGLLGAPQRDCGGGALEPREYLRQS